MSQFAKAALMGVLIGLVGSVLSLTSWMLDLEEQVGLDALFQLRGTRAVPEEVLVVKLDRAAADHLGFSADPAQWPRQAHAQLIDVLSAAGARVVTFDILFREHRSAHEDARLASAIRNAGNVLLFESTDKDLLFEESSGSGMHLTLEQSIQPIAELADAAVGTAPFALPKVPNKISQFWKFGPAASNPATLPMLALHLYAKDELPILIESLQKLRPDAFEVWPSDFESMLSQPGLATFVREMHELFQRDPDLGPELLERMALHEQTDGARRVLPSIVKTYLGGASAYLNFYGPPHSVTNRSYQEMLLIDSEQPSYSGLEDKVVFVGFSASRQWEQSDGFYTVFSDMQSGLDLSGVEILATAFANMLEGSELRQPASYQLMLMMLVWGIIVGSCARLFAVPWAILAVIVLSALYLVSVCQLFIKAYYWLPVVVPLLQSVMALFFGIYLNHLVVNRQRNNIRNAFRQYLPEHEVARLEKMITHPGSGGQLLQGVCLFTDVADYTRLSENTDPIELGRVVNAYYAALFKPVREHGGFVSDVIGDAMVAIWADPQKRRDLRTMACQAAVEILADVDRFNEENHDVQLPTRIGLHHGSMLLGNVGATGHYEYRAVGDIVNTASRIEGANKILGTRFLISEEALEGVSSYMVRELGSFVLAGKTQAVTLYELMGPRGNCGNDLRAICTQFETALALFRAEKFEAADEIFDKILTQCPHDGPSLFYRAHIAELKHVPPDASWSATVVLTGK